VDEEDGQKDKESKFGCGGDGGHNTTQSDLGVPPNDRYTGEKDSELVFSGSGKRSGPVTFIHAEEHDQTAQGNQGNGDPRLHFGPGSAESVDIEVRWPLGLVEQHKSVAVNRLITLKEGSGTIDSQPLVPASPLLRRS
jgi:hypothetical protein